MQQAHRCHPPQRAHRGASFFCWCGVRWVAVDSIIIRDGRVLALRPDWRPGRAGVKPREPAPSTTRKAGPQDRRDSARGKL
jgi:hypothetical protein